MGVNVLAPAALVIAIALRGVLSPRHPAPVLVLAFGCFIGASTAEQTWAGVGWAVVCVACCVTWAVTARRPAGPESADRSDPFSR